MILQLDVVSYISRLEINLLSAHFPPGYLYKYAANAKLIAGSSTVEARIEKLMLNW